MKKAITLTSTTSEITRHLEEAESLLQILMEHEFLSEALDARIEDLAELVSVSKVLAVKLTKEMKLFVK